MTDIQHRLLQIKGSLPQGVELAAVSKYHPAEAISTAYQAGQRIFAESRVQELTAKQASLPPDIRWHFIGHLQTNKVKYIAPFISMIESVDSLRLLREIDRQAKRCARIIPCLLEIHIACEESKGGFSFEECRRMLREDCLQELTHVSINGLMGMASLTSDRRQIEMEFSTLHSFFDELRTTFFASRPEFCQLSMGMSADYDLATQHGSTLVRIGTGIFGTREY